MKNPHPMKKPASGTSNLTAGRSRRRSGMRHRPARVRGVSLVIVMLILVIVSMLGVASVQISMMGERGARNDRDMQLAWQGAEAALVDAEIDLSGPNAASTSRTAVVLSQQPMPEPGCRTSGIYRGFCGYTTTGSTKPTWLTIDFTDQGSSAPSVALGTFTGRSFNNAGTVDGTALHHRNRTSGSVRSRRRHGNGQISRRQPHPPIRCAPHVSGWRGQDLSSHGHRIRPTQRHPGRCPNALPKLICTRKLCHVSPPR